MITINDLVGEWKLEVFTIEKPDGTKKEWGNNPYGILIYTSSGYMSVSINSDVGSSKASTDEIYKNILFYAGTYEIIDGSKVVHHVVNATDINRINKDLVREATLSNDQLQLVSKGDFGAAFLVWKKINNKPDLKVSKVLHNDSPLKSISSKNVQPNPVTNQNTAAVHPSTVIKL